MEISNFFPPAALGSLEALWLGLTQGITEFLPISSSGHLVLLEDFFELPVKGLKNFDVVVHLGTLLAILAYFWRDIWVILRSIFAVLSRKKSSEKLFGVKPIIFVWFLILGTIPAVIVALTAEDLIDDFFRDSLNVAYSFLATGIFFIFAEYFVKKVKSSKLNAKKSIWIGIFQAIAIIPGISRSGSTIGAGLLGGISRAEAAHFSFILGIPALLGAGIFIAFKNDPATMTFSNEAYLIGFTSAFVSGYLSILFLMKFLKKHSLAWFSIYLIPLGIYLLLF